MDDEAGGIFNIALSDSEAEETPSQADRTGQTEEAYQAVKASYSVRVENGNIAETLKLPLGPGADKTQTQDAVYAVEELIFFKRLDDAVELIDRLLSEGSSSKISTGPDRELLELYRSRCEAKREQAAKQTSS